MGEEVGYAREINPKSVIPYRKNKSCFFILPLLGYPSYWYYDLVNCFLGDETNKPEFTLSKIFIQVKTYDSKLTGIPYFNCFYKLEDNTYMFVYNIPTVFENDYTKFYKGEYSKMSVLAKDIICKLSGINPIMNSTVYKVLYKTLDQKKRIEELIGQKLPEDAEVYSSPDLDKEIYKQPLNIRHTDKLNLKERESEREGVL